MIMTLRYNDEYKVVKKDMWYANLTNENGNNDLHILDMSIAKISHEKVYLQRLLTVNVICITHNDVLALYIPLTGGWDNTILNEPYEIERGSE
ncbi:hypothetical protein H8D04_01245 [bacterium]|nr:hypothetical protein [bacterium]